MDYNYNEFIGVLATDEEIQASTGDSSKRSVFINGQNDIQYLVKALSSDAPTRFFTGYINSITDNESLNLDDSSFFDESYEKRIASFRAKISNYVFVFNTRSTILGKDGKKFYRINKADLIARPSPVKDTDAFVSIPVFSPQEMTSDWEYKTGARLERNYPSFEGFLTRLKNGQSIGRVSHFDSQDCPKFIIWYDDEKLSAIGPFSAVSFTALGGYILRFDNLHEIDLGTFVDYTIYNIGLNPSVIHIVESVFEKITNQFVTHDTTNLVLTLDATDTSQETSIDVPPITEEVIDIDPANKDDATLLKTFRRLCEDNNLFYEPKDFTNFHTAMKTGSLVILSGMSGTGKSAIVDMYARALGLRSENDENRVLMIPVRPSWNDDSDLLGYVDLIHMVYRASDTGFVKLLVEASKEENKNNLYIVCFDEMNLARVEHYFSQFLSILEKPSGKRQLRLYDEQCGRLYNTPDYPPVIDSKDNIRFVGTVNVDESTYHFADKVLDRANIIKLHVLPFNSWEKHPYTTKAIQEWTFDEYNAITVKEGRASQSALKDFLWDLHQALQKASSGIGPRIVKSIELYLNNLPASQDEFAITSREGVDIQICQRVLTKIRGSSEQFSQLFEDTEDSLIGVLKHHRELSDFEESLKAIERKKEELKIYGYCL